MNEKFLINLNTASADYDLKNYRDVTNTLKILGTYTPKTYWVMYRDKEFYVAKSLFVFEGNSIYVLSSIFDKIILKHFPNDSCDRNSETSFNDVFRILKEIKEELVKLNTSLGN